MLFPRTTGFHGAPTAHRLLVCWSERYPPRSGHLDAGNPAKRVDVLEMEIQQHSPFPNTCTLCLSERWKLPVWITPKVRFLLSPSLTVAAPDALDESEKNPLGTTSWAASLQSGKASSALTSAFSYPSSWFSALSNMFVSSMSRRKLF